MLLTKTLTNRFAGRENRLVITVGYDPSTNAVELVSIMAEEQRYWQDGNVRHYNAGWVSVDVTNLIADTFTSTDSDIAKIDWEAEYKETKSSKLQTA